MVDVAGRAGVSIKTVSNVVTGTWPVAESTRSRVEAVIAELDYRPNLAARALRTGQPLLPNSG
jgi:DNA-binding LacI/PurR family transcriptional regulator